MRMLILAAALAGAAPALAQAPVPAGLRLDRAVLLMRHGVRPPTKAPAMPEGVAREPWPNWGVPPGHLTQRGAAAVRILAEDDRRSWLRAGLLPRRGCARMRIVADSDQRTIATADAYAAALAPGCTVPIEHKAEGVADPIFSPIDARAVAFNAETARQAVLADAGPDGIDREEARLRPLLTRLDEILCGASTERCGVSREASALTPPTAGKRPKLTGALDRGSTAAQILLLEYADGKPAAEIGWGRAGAADVEALSELHAAEFRILARPRYVAKANLALIVPLVRAALSDANGPAVTMISGHDTDIASLGGLLDLHWRVPGLAADDPSPGGAIVLERLSDKAGRRYVRALYRSQSLEQIRNLTPLGSVRPYVAVLPIPGCQARGIKGLCTLASFAAALKR